MATILIVHGAYGTPSSNWIPWLKAELEKEGHTIIAPKFPTPQGQSLRSWMKVLQKIQLPDDALMVGHSLGVPFLLRVLEKHPAKAVFFAGGFIHLLGNTKYDSINKSFVEQEFEWETIKSHCQRFYIFHGDDDPIVPLREGNKIAEKVGTKLRIIKNGKHLNVTAGFTTFPQLLQALQRELKKILKSGYPQP